jgi:uncharacterized protein
MIIRGSWLPRFLGSQAGCAGRAGLMADAPEPVPTSGIGVGVRINDVSVRDQIQQRRDEILRVAAGHGAGNIRLFGSVARGEETPESDVDLLIDVTGETTPWFPASLIADLEQLLRRPVQVVIHRSLSPLIRDAVLRDAVPL